jgi:hypothetical protein
MSWLIFDDRIHAIKHDRIRKPPMAFITSDVSCKFLFMVRLPREVKTLLAVAFLLFDLQALCKVARSVTPSLMSFRSLVQNAIGDLNRLMRPLHRTIL